MSFVICLVISGIARLSELFLLDDDVVVVDKCFGFGDVL